MRSVLLAEISHFCRGETHPICVFGHSLCCTLALRGLAWLHLLLIFARLHLLLRGGLHALVTDTGGGLISCVVTVAAATATTAATITPSSPATTRSVAASAAAPATTSTGRFSSV